MVDQSCVKKFFDFFFDDVVDFWIDPPLTLHLWWGGNSLSSTSGGGSSSEDWFFGSTTLRIMTITCSGMTPEAIIELISQRVEEALAAQEANRNAGLIDENQSQDGDANDNRSEGNGNHVHEATMYSSHLSRGRMWLKLSRWATMRKEGMLGMLRTATSADCTMKDHVL
nr:hypothetical protein [Tanacetum cinerariifolium]